MAVPLNLKPALDFLAELRLNNNKAWFDAHRPDYNAARQVFEQFIDGIIDEFRDSDHLAGLSARECTARIYRDIRFSKDKSPYKTNLAAMVGPGGWKGPSTLGYYISIGTQGQSIVGGGLYDPSQAQLNRFREEIARRPAEFKALIQAGEFVEVFGTVEGERLKTAPRGYDSQHPEIGLLQLKQITAIRHFADGEVLEPHFTGEVLRACRAMKPFLEYLNRFSA